MNPLTQTFPLVCLIFGICCGLVSLTADHFERRRLRRLQVIRRVMFEPDSRPLDDPQAAIYHMVPKLPWEHPSWFGLNGVEASHDGRERSTRRSL